MVKSTRLVLASIVAMAGFSALPAQAALTTIANFSGINSDTGIRFQSTGTSGSLYTIDAVSNAPGTRQVKFSFLMPGLTTAVDNVTADFTLLATTASPAVSFGSFLRQPNLSGSFSFLSTGAISANGINYSAGANLLSGTFNDVSISGESNASAASYNGSTGGGATILFTSDFVSFNPVSAYDLAISLTSLSPLLSGTPGNTLSTFEAYSTGSFSSDPAPDVNAVPEPAAWLMLIVGFGLVGVTARGRRNVSTTVAA